MSLRGRLGRLEARFGDVRCAGCGAAPGNPAKFATHDEAGGSWEGYPNPLSCGGCGRVLRFTLKLGDTRPGEVGDGA